LKKIKLLSFIKRIVEDGTDDSYTLLSLDKPIDASLTMQKSMQEIIHVQHNTCKHSFKITLDAFIKSNKSCKICLPTKMCAITDRNTVINNSQHNSQAI
jgi:hypothetical protein